jgi:tRNA-Thr(GGU) m(6)t(6)A37 methyltransferase TsaA
MKQIPVELKVIGIIHSPYKTREQAPRQGTNDTSEIEIYNEYEEGLTDIEEYSHIHLFYWLHKSKGYSLMVQTLWEKEKHGVFVTRSPNHPNPIGYSVVKLVERKNNILKVKGLDAIKGTPVIDIKPYIKRIDQKENIVSGWSENIDFKF